MNLSQEIYETEEGETVTGFDVSGMTMAGLFLHTRQGFPRFSSALTRGVCKTTSCMTSDHL